jgi:alpha-1,6-mannosyltransferase
MRRTFATLGTSALYLFCGTTIAIAFFLLARLGSRVGSDQHLSLLAIASVAYGLAIGLLFWRRMPGSRTLIVCVLLAFAARVPLVVKPAGTFDDTHRYSWDARLQRAGLNPYLVVPIDPAYDHLHKRETRLMNNADLPSPYPPGAQLFFLAVTTFGESAVAFKAALVAAEALTLILLMSWLGRGGKESAWALAYAWHPVAIFETASAGHLDALGTMFVVGAAVALMRGWRLSAALALAAGVSVKLLPIVLAPLFFRRVRWMHALAATALLGALYVRFLDGWQIPPGSLGAFVERFRFNQLLFEPVAAIGGARFAAAVALVAGLGAACYMRARGLDFHPAAWAWPIAAALLLSPVIYPWYLIWFLPFVVVRSTLPLLIWSLAIIPAYVVWQQSREGGPWLVPDSVLWFEYGLFGLTVVLVFFASKWRASLAPRT